MQDLLLTYGPLGVAVLGLGIACYALYNRLQKVSDDRLADIKALIERTLTAISENTKTTEALTRAVMEKMR